MTSRISRLFIARAEADGWRDYGTRGRVLLYALSFVGTAIALASVAWRTGGDPLFIALIPDAGLGHVVSALPGRRRFRLSFIIYPAALFIAWTMRVELLTVLSGGSLFPFVKLLAVVQAMASFNLRSMRSLDDSFLLGMTVVLLVSEGALSTQFSVFLLAFGVVALTFLTSAYPVRASRNVRVVGSPQVLGLTWPVVAVVLLTMATAVAVFLAVPQVHRARTASPLPSRLDVTIGRPPTPTDLVTGDTPVIGQFLPSREGEAPPDPDSEPGPVPAPASDAGAVATEDSAAGLEAPSYIELGYAGDDERDVVMYVRSPLASFWRGQVLDEYDGRGWLPGPDDDQIKLDTYGRMHFEDALDPASAEGRYIQSYFPQVVQPNAVFTGYSPGYIALQDPAVEGSRAARARENRRRLSRASGYRVVSAVPALTPEVLKEDSADVSYLNGVGVPFIPDNVRALALAIVADSESDFQKAARLEQYLLTNYDYDLRVSPLSRTGDVVESFLFERGAGYCAQFATAMAVMARAVGLPARVAIGYVPGRYSSLTGAHTVRLQDSHAWVEIKFVEHGWVPFDPTPRPDSPWALDRGFGAATQSFQQLLRSQLRDIVVDSPASAAGAFASFFTGLGPAAVLGAVLASTVALMSMLAFWLKGRRRPWRRDRPKEYTLLPGGDRVAMKAVYVKALKLLGKRGYPQRLPHQSPADYVATLRERGFAVPSALEQISRQAAQALYDPSPLDPHSARDGIGHLKKLRSVPRHSP